ncbi:MAG: hypothetical protein RRY11_08385 [Terrisporobacter sp.]
MKKLMLSIGMVLITIVVLLTSDTNKESIMKDGEIIKIEGIEELKNNSSTIVKATGTDKNREINYKGINCIITTLTVDEVIKGDKKLKNIEIIQVRDIDSTPKENEKLLLYLREGEDNKGVFVPVGGNQGIFPIDI